MMGILTTITIDWHMESLTWVGIDILSFFFVFHHSTQMLYLGRDLVMYFVLLFFFGILGCLFSF